MGGVTHLGLSYGLIKYLRIRSSSDAKHPSEFLNFPMLGVSKFGC